MFIADKLSVTLHYIVLFQFSWTGDNCYHCLINTYLNHRLTAFVIKSFQEASEFITVDTQKIETNLKWILSQQETEGWFNEPGSTHNSYLKVVPPEKNTVYLHNL